MTVTLRPDCAVPRQVFMRPARPCLMGLMGLMGVAALMPASARAQASAFSREAGEPVPAGTVWHYEKSNRDGSEAWRFAIYFASPSRVEVLKWLPGEDLVEVHADLDLARAMPVHMQQWNLVKGERRPTLSADAAPEASRLTVHFAKGGQLVLDGGALPLHVWGFDLASLAPLLPMLRHKERGLRLSIADPNRPGRQGEPALVDEARFEYLGQREWQGRPTHQYRITGPVFEGQSGLLVSSLQGQLLHAEHPVPTSTDWKDWRLSFVRAEQLNGNQWEQFKLALQRPQPAGD